MYIYIFLTYPQKLSLFFFLPLVFAFLFRRRLPGDVTLPNDARFIDWVAVVYSLALEAQVHSQTEKHFTMYTNRPYIL